MYVKLHEQPSPLKTEGEGEFIRRSRFLETSDRAFNRNGWINRIRWKRWKKKPEYTFKRRYDIAGDDIASAIAKTQADGLGDAELEIDWGYSRMTLSTTWDGSNKYKDTTSRDQFTTDDAISYAKYAMPYEKVNWEREGWGTETLSRAQIVGPLQLMRANGLWGETEVTIDILSIPGSTSPIVELSFKVDGYGKAADMKRQLTAELDSAAILLKKDSLKTQGILDACLEKEAAAITQEPLANTLTYTGFAQELVTAGTASGGTLQYILGTDGTTAPVSTWETSIPVAANTGTYYVWYKVIGDANHADSVPVCIPVMIREAEKKVSVIVTLKVVHGEWGDDLGGRDDRTIFLNGPLGTELRLQFDQIPDVTKPDEGYSAETGSWDKEPPFVLAGLSFGDPITEDTVYTYTYGNAPEISEYFVAEGSNQTYTTGSGENLTFVFKQTTGDETTFDNFFTAQTDGQPLSCDVYETRKRSLILTLKAAFLDILSAGKHTLKAFFKDNASVEVVFTVAAAKPISVVPDMPKTGDGADPALWLVLLLLSTTALIFAAGKQRQKK